MVQRTGLKTTEVMQTIRAKVASRAFAAGDRLPSIRTMASTMKVSPSTVVEAYDRLTAEGLVRARRGSGFYIAAPTMPLLASAEVDRNGMHKFDSLSVSRQLLDANPGVLKPGCGWLPSDWMPTDAIRRGFRSLARAEGSILTDYGNTRGPHALQRLLLSRLSEDGVELSAEQLLPTGSGTQAIDLICRLFLRPGDTVLVDDPCYFNLKPLLRIHQANIVGVPYTPTGPDVAQFEAILAAKQPRLYITNAALQNPTGATLSPQTAHRLLNAAAAHDLTIIEDDIFVDFEPEPSPRLSALDGLKRVIRVGSFSKTVSASVRCGYIAARKEWIRELVNLQRTVNFGGPSPFAVELIVHILTSGRYRKHMEDTRLRLVRVRREVAMKLSTLGIELWLMPRGGLYLWCKLPNRLKAVDVARATLKENVVLAPGDVFGMSGEATEFLRFNVAQSSHPRIWQILHRAIESNIRHTWENENITDQ
jgi:DNA-binding transcriptional MocR family regulator